MNLSDTTKQLLNRLNVLIRNPEYLELHLKEAEFIAKIIDRMLFSNKDAFYYQMFIDLTKAVDAQSNPNPHYAFLLSVCFMNGIGNPYNWDQALIWACYAETQGHALAIEFLEKVVLISNPFKEYRRLNGPEFGNLELPELIEKYKKDAESGWIEPACRLGAIYSTYFSFGPENLRNDVEALKWYRFASSRKSKIIYSHLRNLQDKIYRHISINIDRFDEYIIKNFDRTIEYLELIKLFPEIHDKPGELEYLFGKLYQLKKDPKHNKKAFELFLLAAHLGYPLAMTTVANIYGEGSLGVEKNTQLALDWVEKEGGKFHWHTDKLIDDLVRSGNPRALTIKTNQLILRLPDPVADTLHKIVKDIEALKPEYESVKQELILKITEHYGIGKLLYIALHESYHKEAQAIFGFNFYLLDWILNVTPKYNPRTDLKCMKDVLFYAFENFKTFTFDKLMGQYSGDIFTENTEGDTLLHKSISKNRLISTEHFLEQGAYFDILNQQGQTPAALASTLPKGTKKPFVALFNKIQRLFELATTFNAKCPEYKQRSFWGGAILNARRITDGNTPVHCAVLSGNLAFLEQIWELDQVWKNKNFFEYPYDYLITNHENQTAWDMALKNSGTIGPHLFIKLGIATLQFLKKNLTRCSNEMMTKRAESYYSTEMDKKALDKVKADYAYLLHRIFNILEALSNFLLTLPLAVQLTYYTGTNGLLSFIENPSETFQPLRYYEIVKQLFKEKPESSDSYYKEYQKVHAKIAEFFLLGNIVYKKISKGIEDDEIVLTVGKGVFESDTDETRNLRHCAYLYHSVEGGKLEDPAFQTIASEFVFGSHNNFKGFPDFSFSDSDGMSGVFQGQSKSFTMNTLLHLKKAEMEVAQLKEETQKLREKLNERSGVKAMELISDADIEFEIVDDDVVMKGGEKSVLGKRKRDDKEERKEGSSEGSKKEGNEGEGPKRDPKEEKEEIPSAKRLKPLNTDIVLRF